jgi:hypothetical protein
MAPGYRSPFNHPLPHKTHTTAAIFPFLAIFLCLSIILCLILFTLCVTTSRDHDLPQRDDNSTSVIFPRPEMVLDEASAPDYLAMHTHRGPRKITNIRDVFPQDGDDIQPLLQGELYDDPLEQSTSVEMTTRPDGNVHKKGSINWHGTNTLNTSWGWMA